MKRQIANVQITKNDISLTVRGFDRVGRRAILNNFQCYTTQKKILLQLGCRYEMGCKRRSYRRSHDNRVMHERNPKLSKTFHGPKFRGKLVKSQENIYAPLRNIYRYFWAKNTATDPYQHTSSHQNCR